MENIVEISERERVFYFSDFIYFVKGIDFSHPNSLQITVGRILELLILFDKIMIPSEHITISTSNDEVIFKIRFFSHPVIKLLIEKKNIVTTIWGVCRDARDHLEASTRYKREIKASIIQNRQLNKHVTEISIYKRNQKGQSGSALEQARKNGWKYGRSTDDFLSYRDEVIEIPFSHERLLLGDGQGKFTDNVSINAAKLAYIQAMPSGNGSIYRSQIAKIELTNGDCIPNLGDRLPPSFFTPTTYRQILRMTGLNAPFSFKALHNPMWIKNFISLENEKTYIKYKHKVFEALEYISSIVFARTEDQAKELLKHIRYVRWVDVIALGWELTKPHKFAPILTAKWRKEIGDYIVVIPSYPVYELNRMANAYK